MNGSLYSDGWLVNECENGHERTNDIKGLYNVPNSRQDFLNDGYAGQGSLHYLINILTL